MLIQVSGRCSEQDHPGDHRNQCKGWRQRRRSGSYDRHYEIAFDEVDREIHRDDRQGVGWALSEGEQSRQRSREDGAKKGDEREQSAEKA